MKPENIPLRAEPIPVIVGVILLAIPSKVFSTTVPNCDMIEPMSSILPNGVSILRPAIPLLIPVIISATPRLMAVFALAIDVLIPLILS